MLNDEIEKRLKNQGFAVNNDVTDEIGRIWPYRLTEKKTGESLDFGNQLSVRRFLESVEIISSESDDTSPNEENN